MREVEKNTYFRNISIFEIRLKVLVALLPIKELSMISRHSFAAMHTAFTWFSRNEKSWQIDLNIPDYTVSLNRTRDLRMEHSERAVSFISHLSTFQSILPN